MLILPGHGPFDMRFVTASGAKQPRGSRTFALSGTSTLGCFAPLAKTAWERGSYLGGHAADHSDPKRRGTTTVLLWLLRCLNGRKARDNAVVGCHQRVEVRLDRIEPLACHRAGELELEALGAA